MTTYGVGAAVEGEKKIWAQGLYEESSTQKERLGRIRTLDDGRVFVYAKDSGSGLAPGHLCTRLTTPTHEDTVTVAHPIGTKVVTITASGAAAHDYRDGYLIVTEGTGIGEMYKIKDNDAADASNLIRVQLYEGLATAWVITDTDVDLYKNPFGGVFLNPVDSQQKPVLCTVRTVTASYYFWGLKEGWGPLKMDVASAAGLELDEKFIQASTNHAGQGMLTTTPANADMKHIIGEVIKEEDISDDTVTLVRLML